MQAEQQRRYTVALALATRADGLTRAGEFQRGQAFANADTMPTNTVPSLPADAAAVPTPGAEGYFARRLSFTDRTGEVRTVDEAGMLAIPGPRIVLGEPGMGKSELMREVGRRLALPGKPVTAIAFMVAKTSSRFVIPGKPLLIDGLDEAMERREGDAVDTILDQLVEAGCPEFVLSCRAREWQERGASKLRALYGMEPTVFTLVPFDRDEATAFLSQHHPTADGQSVLDHLDTHGLSDLYRNPLTLDLMGRVAETDKSLPRTRAALFERVCALTWPEHDPDRQESGLNQLTEEQALSAAGAVAAGLILAGAEAASLAGPAHVQEGDVRLAELADLPGVDAEAAFAVVSSKLFVSVGDRRAKPIHRVIGEYLGARWLAGRAATPRAQRRLLAQLHGNGVPASLRGIHAWLAFHSPAMAERVIAADPYGVLRYGETAQLSPTQAEHLFDALSALAKDNPYFRAADWGAHTAAALAVPILRDKIDSVIGSTSSNAHLRSLLIEALKDTPMAGELSATLAAIVMSDDRFDGEREAAAKALLPHRDRGWWHRSIETLRDQGTKGATGLARRLIALIGYDVDNDLLVSTLLTEMGALVCPLPRGEARRHATILSYNRIGRDLAETRLARVLDLIDEYSGFLSSDWLIRNTVADLVATFVLRTIDDGVVGPADAASLWRWLRIAGGDGQLARTSQSNLKDRLGARDDLRRAIQLHAFDQRQGRPFWKATDELDRRMVGINGRPADIAWFLDRLADADNKDAELREEWRHLISLGAPTDVLDAKVRASGLKFQRNDSQLAACVRKLEHPKKPAWKRREERDAAKREKKRRITFEFDRRHYAANRADMRAGVLAAVFDPSRVYLGQFNDFKPGQPPADRIAEWLGPELRDDAIAGFEAALHRADLPTPELVAEGIAEDLMYHFGDVILAGLLARLRDTRGFDDLSPDVLKVGLLTCLNTPARCEDEDVADLRATLEAVVVPTPRDREDFARLWIEPSLAAGRDDGLHTLTHDADWRETGRALAGPWLLAFPALPQKVESQLVDCLIEASAMATLEAVAVARSGGVHRTFQQLLFWLAVEVLVRFDHVRPDIDGIVADNPDFLWLLRDRVGTGRRDGGFPLTVAQARWIVSEFRRAWPYAEMPRSVWGGGSPYDATDFLRALIHRLANDTGDEAAEALLGLAAEPEDTYSDLIRHMAAEQRQKRAEKAFAPLPPVRLRDLLTEGPPSNADDLKALVLEELAVAQRKLRGDDLDQVRDFWNDAGVPYDENRCRDRLAAMIGPELARYGVQRMTEADMPQSKRADLAFACDLLQLPMEVKGQWHDDVWDAATSQLDARYLTDWRSGDRGIYGVLWFGPLPSSTGRRLKVPPDGSNPPTTPEEMRAMLVARIPESRRTLIDVVVLDLTAGAR